MYSYYLDMIAEAESFMKAYKIRMTGEGLKPGSQALVIPKESLDKFAKKLRSKEISESVTLKTTERVKETLRTLDNPYDVPEQSSGSDDAAFYFPFGRE